MKTSSVWRCPISRGVWNSAYSSCLHLVKAVDHGDFYKAIRHSLSLANEPLDLGFMVFVAKSPATFIPWLFQVTFFATWSTELLQAVKHSVKLEDPPTRILRGSNSQVLHGFRRVATLGCVPPWNREAWQCPGILGNRTRVSITSCTIKTCKAWLLTGGGLKKDGYHDNILAIQISDDIYATL